MHDLQQGEAGMRKKILRAWTCPIDDEVKGLLKTFDKLDLLNSVAELEEKLEQLKKVITDQMSRSEWDKRISSAAKGKKARK